MLLKQCFVDILYNVGGIAQLGERLHGMQEVSGSIPLTSTNLEKTEMIYSRFFHYKINYLICRIFNYSSSIILIKLSPVNKKFFPQPAFCAASISRSLSPTETDCAISMPYLSRALINIPQFGLRSFPLNSGQ